LSSWGSSCRGLHRGRGGCGCQLVTWHHTPWRFDN
jgi:hypothetical protein